MPYQTTTLGTATSAVSNRLNDTGYIRWTQAELAGLIIEALRTWGAITASFRDEGVIPTTPFQPFYDLAVALPALRGYTVTDQNLISAIEYTLLEPQGLTAWTGTPQFLFSDVVNAIQRRRDDFLLRTGAVQTRQTLGIAPPPDGRIPLPETVVTVRRAAWTLLNGTVSPILRADEWSFRAFSPAWVQDPGTPPEHYSVGVTPPLVMQVVPPPLATGILDLVSVSRGTPLTPASGPTPLGIPDDWTWVVKFGALADLFGQDGLAFDAGRAQYCEERYQQGIQLATLASVVLSARITNITCNLNSLSDTDKFDRNWQTTPGAPTDVMLAGQNLVIANPPPDANTPSGQYGITLDLVRNTPVPSSYSDYLQVGPEVLDVIYDYAQHVALLKEGAAQIAAAQGLMDRFLTMAGVTLGIQQASIPSRKALAGQTAQDERQVPRTLPPEPVTVGGGIR